MVGKQEDAAQREREEQLKELERELNRTQRSQEAQVTCNEHQQTDH
jgi:hypothetical protein